MTQVQSEFYLGHQHCSARRRGSSQTDMICECWGPHAQLQDPEVAL